MNVPDIRFPNLGISFENVPSVLFSIFGLEIYMYAVCIVTGIISAYYLGIWWVKRSGQKVDDYNDLLMLGVPLAIIGLRLYYVVFNWKEYSGQNFFRVFINFRDGGLAIYGGIIACVISATIIAYRKKIPFTVIADTAAPSMLLGQVIGRFGNFFNREAFGGYTDNLFAMQIYAGDVRSKSIITNEIMENVVTFNGAAYYQVHPTFLYEAFFNLLLMIALIIYRPRKKFDGEIVLLYFVGYGVIRFFVESLRTDQMIFLNTGLPLNQGMAVLFAVVSLGLIVAGHLRIRSKK